MLYFIRKFMLGGFIKKNNLFFGLILPAAAIAPKKKKTP